MIVLWTKSCLLYHSFCGYNRPPCLCVTRFPGFRFRSSLLTSLRWPATPPFQSGVCRQKKSIRGFFLDCRSQGLLHVANPPSMARYSLARNKSVPCTRSAASSGPSKGTFPKKRHLLNGGVLPCLLLQFL